MTDANVFATDDGSCPPRLAAALATGMTLAVAAALKVERLLVPVVPAPEGSLEEDDNDPCGTGDAMASVTFVAADGRRALLAFSDLAALHAWDPQARPLPQAGHEVMTAAIAGGMDAVIVDFAAAHRTVLGVDVCQRVLSAD